MKRLLLIIMAVILIAFTIASCNKTNTNETTETTTTGTTPSTETTSPMIIGIIRRRTFPTKSTYP